MAVKIESEFAELTNKVQPAEGGEMDIFTSDHSHWLEIESQPRIGNSCFPPDSADTETMTITQSQQWVLQRAQVNVDSPTPGAVIGEYTVREFLGFGGSGMVFRAEHLLTKQSVAIKILRKESQDLPDSIERFRKEATVGTRIRHRNLVATLGAGEYRGSPVLIMELVEGKSLRDIVAEKGPLSVEQAIDAIRQAAVGLAELHRKGIAHRDVKPSNLLVDQTFPSSGQTVGTIKVSDFGVSQRISGSSCANRNSIDGTVDYMAPEQAVRPEVVDPRSDLYGLGCTLHFLLTGRPVFRGQNLLHRLIAHRESPIPILSQRCPGVPECLTNVFSKLLAKRPDERTASARELIAALGA